jgi:hypothetical protein
MKIGKIITILPFAICIFHFAAVFADDVLYLKTGEEYLGTIKQITSGTVVIATEKTTLKFSRDQVSSIDFSQRRAGDTWRTTSDVTDPLLKQLLGAGPTDNDYPTANYLTQYIELNVSVKPDSSIEKVYRVVRKVLTEPGKDVANTGEYFDSYYETARVDFGRGLTPDGRITHIRDAAIEDISVHPSPAQYDRFHELKIALPEAQIGSVLDYQVSRSQKKFDDFNPLYTDMVFGDAEPIQVNTVRVTIPQDWELNYWGKAVGQPEIRESGNKKTFSWQVNKTPPLFDEPNRPPLAELVPRLVVGLKADWKELARRYETVLKDSLNAPAMVKLLADSLISGLPGTDERVTALYNFVAKNIRYIPVRLDEFSVIPHSIKTILGQRLGNNLDKSFLLYGLLCQIGVNAQLVLVPSRDRGPFVPEVPSLAQFDEALVLVNDTLFLEPFTDRMPAGVLTGEVQAVSGIAIGSGKICKTPLAPAPAEALVLETAARLDESGALDALTTIKLSGSEGIAWRGYKEQSKAQTEVALNQFVNQIHPEAQLLDYKFSDLGDLSQPVRLEIHYQIPGYALKTGKFLLFTLPGVQYSAWEVGKPERQYPVSFNHLSLTNHKLTIQYPWGYSIYSLPAGANATSAAIGYNSIFRVSHNKIMFEDYLERDATTIPVENYKDYQQAIETAASQSLGMIVLKRSK